MTQSFIRDYKMNKIFLSKKIFIQTVILDHFQNLRLKLHHIKKIIIKPALCLI